MHAHRQLLVFTALFLQNAVIGTAQDYTETVWSVFAYTTSGDTTPSVLVQHRRPAELSIYGANQLAAAGSIFGDRYVSPTATSKDSSRYAIQYITPNNLDSGYVTVFTTTEQYDIASAQAFMQGLYPPVSNGNETLANGDTYNSPLDGYQYPRIVTLGESDPQSLVLAGSAKCDMHHAAVSEYRDSNEVQQITRETEAFYTDIWGKYLSGVYEKPSATYINAVGISQYLEYEALHNTTMRKLVTPYELRRARWLADQYTYATNGLRDGTINQSTIGITNPIAGETLAASILQAFDANMNSQGADQKMTLLFGGDNPAVSLASLIGLASDQHANFYSRLVQGGSLVFELYTLEADGDLPTFPNEHDLYVRFLLHNGTDSSTEFISYPLFGHGPSRTSMTYIEFKSEVETFAVQSVREWCLRCNSASIYCEGILGHGNSMPRQKKHMAPAVAGVIGAVVTLVVIGIVAAIVFLLCGFRKLRGQKASIGGFKGDGKLASDTDVSFRNPIWGASKSTEHPNDISAVRTGLRGHERMGSWEMGQQKKENGNDSALTGEDLEEILPCGLQPVKARETV